jgi:N-acetylglucosaminyldiphosphoundecaprenol N-acetyl-beta-D-mannosaminyltransferase
MEAITGTQGINHSMKIACINILGVGVSAVNMELALLAVDDWIIRCEAHYVCVRDVHGIVESQRSEDLRRIHNVAGMVTPDGMPLVWLSHLKGYRIVDRVYGPDLLLAVCEHSLALGYRHFFYGSDSGVPELLSKNLQSRFPGLKVAGTYSPPFRPLTAEEDNQVIARINGAHPDIVWVGLSTPKQEYWMAEHIGRLSAPVLIGIGAAFDFHAGIKKQAPRWMQRRGLEWLFRLASEPRRLWRRYLIDNPLFALLVLAQALGIKKYSID